MVERKFSADAAKTQARAAGFHWLGITPAVPSPTLAAYLRWIEAGMQGEMAYMARADRVLRRRDLNAILPGARSLLVVGVDYGAAVPGERLQDPARGRFAMYAWGSDYHDDITPRLEMLAEGLLAASGQRPSQRVYVDTGALLERSHAQQAGLGFVGKNTMLIQARRGSYFFLGEILTDLEFDHYDTPHNASMCGSCRRCLAACPTDAFPQPYVLDARRCISYLTIEHKGWIERALRPLLGNWVYGCDVCQEVCPFQRFAPLRPASAQVAERAAPPLLELLALDEAGFRERFWGTAVYRLRRERLLRNVCVAAGNWGHENALAPLARLLQDASPLLRGHAVWGLARLKGRGEMLGAEVDKVLRTLAERETDADVRAEIAAVRGDSQVKS
ncbi:MAG: tRNA epoxyqueuosine(34) reductase QueG [Chloroflexi bacterium]|nr:tRNA epoxyqueuosine(34) reductase QueG [Chloroflexota bacterium]